MNASRRRIAALLGLSLLAGAATGCGQKGPLYFREESEEKKKKEKTTLDNRQHAPGHAARHASGRISKRAEA